MTQAPFLEAVNDLSEFVQPALPLALNKYFSYFLRFFYPDIITIEWYPKKRKIPKDTNSS